MLVCACCSRYLDPNGTSKNSTCGTSLTSRTTPTSRQPFRQATTTRILSLLDPLINVHNNTPTVKDQCLSATQDPISRSLIGSGTAHPSWKTGCSEYPRIYWHVRRRILGLLLKRDTLSLSLPPTIFTLLSLARALSLSLSLSLWRQRK